MPDSEWWFVHFNLTFTKPKKKKQKCNACMSFSELNLFSMSIMRIFLTGWALMRVCLVNHYKSSNETVNKYKIIHVTQHDLWFGLRKVPKTYNLNAVLFRRKNPRQHATIFNVQMLKYSIWSLICCYRFPPLLLVFSDRIGWDVSVWFVRHHTFYS